MLDVEGTAVLVDPFLSDSPVSKVEPESVNAEFILLTHGHFDHVTDAPSIAKRTSAKLVAGFEVSEWMKKQGVAEENVVGLNPGGGVNLPFGRVKMTPAIHSSSMPDGSYGGVAGGFLLELATHRIYLAGDTSLMLDMKLIGIGGLDLAVLPIGDVFTMGPEESIEAVKLLSPKQVIPCHYDTWPPISQDAGAWADQVRTHTAAEPIVLEVGQDYSL